MKIQDLLEGRRYSSDGTTEITLELSSENDSVEVTVECEYDIEPTEYEGSYVFWRGGASLTNTKILPFEFMGKKHTDIGPELIQYLETSKEVEKKFKSVLDKARDGHEPTAKEAKDIVDMMIDEAFERAAEDIEIPSKHYPMTR